MMLEHHIEHRKSNVPKFHTINWLTAKSVVKPKIKEDTFRKLINRRLYIHTT